MLEQDIPAFTMDPRSLSGPATIAGALEQIEGLQQEGKKGRVGGGFDDGREVFFREA